MGAAHWMQSSRERAHNSQAAGNTPPGCRPARAGGRLNRGSCTPLRALGLEGTRRLHWESQGQVVPAPRGRIHDRQGTAGSGAPGWAEHRQTYILPDTHAHRAHTHAPTHCISSKKRQQPEQKGKLPNPSNVP